MTQIAKYITFDPSAPIAPPKSDDSPFFKAEPGENILRIVPMSADMASKFASVGLEPTPFVPVPKHFYARPGGDGYVSTQCPKKLGAGPCPICEESDILRASADEGDRDLGWDMAAKPKRLVNVIVRGQEAAGPKIWELSTPMGKPKGMTMFEKLVAAMSGSAGVDAIDPINGYDIILTKTVTGKGKMGTSYTIVGARQPSPLGTPEQINAWMAQQEDLLAYRVAPDVELVRQKMAGEAPSPGAPRSAPPAASLPASPNTPYNSDDDFAF